MSSKLFATAALCAAALTACSRRDLDPKPPVNAPAPPPRLIVAFSGEDLGRLEPCGCTGGMLGGFARRPARLRASTVPGVPTVFVSGGSLVAGSDEYDEMRMRVMLRALRSMDCAAFAPTGREVASANLIAARTPVESRVPITVATAPASPLVERMVRVPAAGFYVFVAGLSVSSARRPDPAAEIRSLRAEAIAGAPLVVLTDVDESTARVLAKGVGGPTLVLFAGGRTDPRAEDASAGSVGVAPYPAQGKYVGFARLSADGASWSIEYRPVVHELPEDPAIVDLRRLHVEEMRAAGLVAKSAANVRFAISPAPAEGERFVGNAACADCHAEACAKWTSSSHAKAWASLVATRDDADPACVKCHVVGYGTGRGFVDDRSTPLLVDVGCEACHGARGRHVDARRGGAVDPRGPVVSARGCVPCHDGEHDPNFEFAPYWKRIEHGSK